VRSRREFLREGFAVCVVFVAAGCSPGRKRARPTSTTQVGGFGGRIDAGSVARVRSAIADAEAPHYVVEARAYVSPFPTELAEGARGAYPAAILPLLTAGLVVLYQRCTHLGCRVPWCASSQWFECPCHDAKFDRVGEYRQGPAPRGMDLFAASIERGRLVIDTSSIFPGVAVGTNTTHQATSGPFCV
jgi:cytochrome b6-f complex iron-sulfur subunit